MKCVSSGTEGRRVEEEQERRGGDKEVEDGKSAGRWREGEEKEAQKGEDENDDEEAKEEENGKGMLVCCLVNVQATC